MEYEILNSEKRGEIHTLEKSSLYMCHGLEQEEVPESVLRGVRVTEPLLYW